MDFYKKSCDLGCYDGPSYRFQLRKETVIAGRKKGIAQYEDDVKNGKIANRKNLLDSYIIGGITWAGHCQAFYDILRINAWSEFDSKQEDSGLIEGKGTSFGHDRFIVHKRFREQMVGHNNIANHVTFSRADESLCRDDWEKQWDNNSNPKMKICEISGFATRASVRKICERPEKIDANNKIKNEYILMDDLQPIDEKYWGIMANNLANKTHNTKNNTNAKKKNIGKGKNMARKKNTKIISSWEVLSDKTLYNETVRLCDNVDSNYLFESVKNNIELNNIISNKRDNGERMTLPKFVFLIVSYLVPAFFEWELKSQRCKHILSTNIIRGVGEKLLLHFASNNIPLLRKKDGSAYTLNKNDMQHEVTYYIARCLRLFMAEKTAAYGRPIYITRGLSNIGYRTSLNNPSFIDFSNSFKNGVDSVTIKNLMNEWESFYSEIGRVEIDVFSGGSIPFVKKIESDINSMFINTESDKNEIVQEKNTSKDEPVKECKDDIVYSIEDVKRLNREANELKAKEKAAKEKAIEVNNKFLLQIGMSKEDIVNISMNLQ